MDNFWNYTSPRTGPGIPCKNANTVQMQEVAWQGLASQDQ